MSGLIPDAHPRQGGFTLIEVMLAITLVALIMAMAYGGFRASIRATGSGETLIEETNRVRVAHEFVRRQMALALPLIIEDDQGVAVRFEGDSDRVRFIAPMPGYLSYGGPYVQELRLEPSRDGIDLVFAWAMLNGYEPGDLDLIDPVPLVENMAGGEFHFLGLDAEREEVFWDNYWDDPAVMPLAVSLELNLDRSDGLVWPPLVTPLRIDSGATQPRQLRAQDILDPVSRRGLQRISQ